LIFHGGTSGAGDGAQVTAADVLLEAFHALAFREAGRLEDDAAHADGPQVPPSVAQQFLVRNASRRFIDAKSAE
jgi:hypothetical protein